MKLKFQNHQIRKMWFAFFGVWLILISGLLDFYLKSPGLKQWLEVELLLQKRRQEIADIEIKAELYKNTADQLEHNPIAQEREIRKVLGYLGEQEIVFEFSR